jgi:hypothetical protein
MSVNTQELVIDLWDSLDASNLLSALDESSHPEMLPMGGQPVEVSHEPGCDDTITVTWNDMCEWDRENDAHHAVFSRDYPHAYLGGSRIRDGVTKEEPEIKAERGGALDEFLDEFKP